MSGVKCRITKNNSALMPNASAFYGKIGLKALFQGPYLPC